MAALCLASVSSAFVYGAGSESTGISVVVPSAGTGSATANVPVSAGQTIVAKSDSGTAIIVEKELVLPSGQKVTISVNEKGQAVVNNTVLSFANGSAATAGLPEQTKTQIDAVNKGQSLADSIKDVELNGYYALGQTTAIVTSTNDAQQKVNDAAEVPVILSVPNLVDGLQNVQVLFYSNATGKWVLLPISSINIKNKQLIVNIKGSGTLTAVYKK